MMKHTLEQDGDALEQSTWNDIGALFPHYEEFWRTHLVPLRAKGSIQPRRGIDEDFEILAMFHYSTYVHICRASEKSQDAANVSRFPDEIYIHLYGAAELGFKLVEKFNHIFKQCTGKNSSVASQQLRELKERFSDYRNLVHEQITGVGLDEANRLMIPKPEKLGDYRRWTAVLYERREEDFVDASFQISNDSHSLYSALETAWKGMCALSEKLVKNETYLQRQSQGESPRIVYVIGPLLSGAQVYSSTAISTVLVSSASDPKFNRR